MVFDPGSGQRILAGIPIAGGEMQDGFRDTFRPLPVQGHALRIMQRSGNRVLQGLRWSRCLVYLDDIISFGTTFDDSLDNLTLIFE